LKITEKKLETATRRTEKSMAKVTTKGQLMFNTLLYRKCIE